MHFSKIISLLGTSLALIKGIPLERRDDETCGRFLIRENSENGEQYRIESKECEGQQLTNVVKGLKDEICGVYMAESSRSHQFSRLMLYYIECPEGQCCGKDGKCGTGSDFCGAGCQNEFGKCDGSEKIDIIPRPHDEWGSCRNCENYKYCGRTLAMNKVLGAYKIETEITSCGINEGDGKCCKNNFCGDGDDFCGVGCISELGQCNNASPSDNTNNNTNSDSSSNNDNNSNSGSSSNNDNSNSGSSSNNDNSNSGSSSNNDNSNSGSSTSNNNSNFSSSNTNNNSNSGSSNNNNNSDSSNNNNDGNSVASSGNAKIGTQKPILIFFYCFSISVIFNLMF